MVGTQQQSIVGSGMIDGNEGERGEGIKTQQSIGVERVGSSGLVLVNSFEESTGKNGSRWIDVIERWGIIGSWLGWCAGGSICVGGNGIEGDLLKKLDGK
jgi:hypothetical protein